MQSSNVATYIAHGDVALSVLMTTASTLGAIVMTPLLTKTLAGAYIAVDAKVCTLKPAPAFLNYSSATLCMHIHCTHLHLCNIWAVVMFRVAVAASAAVCPVPERLANRMPS